MSTPPKEVLKQHLKRAIILFDTGCGGTLVDHTLVSNLKSRSIGQTKWSTKTGTFTTSRKVKCDFTLPEFHEGWDIFWSMYVDESYPRLGNYDMIIGRYLLHELGMDLYFKDGSMWWDNDTVLMKDIDCFSEENIDHHEQ